MTKKKGETLVGDTWFDSNLACREHWRHGIAVVGKRREW